jgi:hypothetical protein
VLDEKIGGGDGGNARDVMVLHPADGWPEDS